MNAQPARLFNRRALLSLLLASSAACDPQRQPPDSPTELPMPAPPTPDDGTGAVADPDDRGSSYGPSPETGVGGISEAIPELNGRAPAVAPEGTTRPMLPIEGPVASTPVSEDKAGAWIARRAGSGVSALASERVVGTGGLGMRGGGVGGGGLADSAAAPIAEGSSGGYGRGAGRVAARPKMAADRDERATYAPPAQQAPLRAGTTDDNADFDDYLSYIQAWQGAESSAGALDRLEVSGQRQIRVVDARGRGLPGAQVSVVHANSGEAVWTAHTTGEGLAPYYPKLTVPGLGQAPGGEPEAAELVAVASFNGERAAAAWTPGQTTVELRVPVLPQEPPAVPIDVCFIIDTTGSMSDEIARVQQTLLAVTQRLRAHGAVDLRYGAVLYRDVGDEYLTLQHPFTSDIRACDNVIQGIRAGGGGDGPESLNQGLAVGIGQMDWRPGAAKVAFLIADAPPHMDYQGDVTYGRAAAGAVYRGVRVHTVAASGLDPAGSAVFRQIAQLTHGRFIFIEYGSTAAAARSHGVTGEVSSNNLDQIIYDRIQAEVTGWRGGDARLAQQR